MKLDMTRDAANFLTDLSKNAKQYTQVTKKVLSLMGDPRPVDSEDLTGCKKPYRRTDCGEYRIIYLVEGDVVQIILVGKRNGDEVYERLKRQEKGQKDGAAG